MDQTEIEAKVHAARDHIDTWDKLWAPEPDYFLEKFREDVRNLLAVIDELKPGK